LTARQRKQAYRTSRDEAPTAETLEEKMARIKREIEEVRIQMLKENKSDDEVQKWDKLMSGVSSEDSAVTLLTSRIQKLETTQELSSQVQSL
jgi:hypothetical protein